MRSIILLLTVLLVGFLSACNHNPDDVVIVVPDDTTYYPGELPTNPGPRHDTVFEVGGVQFVMRYVEGGSFSMGASSSQGSRHRDVDALSDESPVHYVYLSPYLIAECEVSQALFHAVLGYNPSDNIDLFLPVHNVSYTSAVRFLDSLRSYTGFYFRLPTEAEWEFAARGGANSTDYRFSGSDNADEVAWYLANSDSMIHIVKTKAPNALGLYDMSGNLFEWCSDWYGVYSPDPQDNPQGPDKPNVGNLQKHVIRGGSYREYPFYLRNTARQARYASYEEDDIGFRMVISCQ